MKSKIWPLRPRKWPLDLKDLSGSVMFFQKNNFSNQGKALRKITIARLFDQTLKITSFLLWPVSSETTKKVLKTSKDIKKKITGQFLDLLNASNQVMAGLATMASPLYILKFMARLIWSWFMVQCPYLGYQRKMSNRSWKYDKWFYSIVNLKNVLSYEHWKNLYSTSFLIFFFWNLTLFFWYSI